MEIRNINNTPNFTGIYKLPKADPETLRFVANELPRFAQCTNTASYAFNGRHPIDGTAVKVIKEVVEECRRYSYDWLTQNAQRYGITLPMSDTPDLWVITGKDKNVLEKYFSEATKLRKENTSFWNRLKRLFVSTDEPTRNVPSYLRQIVPMLKENDEFAEIFQRLVEKEKVVEVKNKEQLFMSMLLER